MDKFGTDVDDHGRAHTATHSRVGSRPATDVDLWRWPGPDRATGPFNLGRSGVPQIFPSTDALIEKTFLKKPAQTRTVMKLKTMLQL